MPKSLTTAAMLLALATACAPALHAFTITPVYAIPEAWSAQEQAVIGRAISDWTGSLAFNNGNQQNININFYRVTAPTSAFLANWQFGGVVPTSYPYSPGIVHSVYVNDAFAPLFSANLDPTPDPNAYDFLTIIRHELGHALGFTDRIYLDNGTDRWTSHITDYVFDPGGLNVPMRQIDGIHVDLPDDLMYYQLPKGIRKDISPTDLAMLSLAYGFTPLVPIPEPASLPLLAAATLLLTRRRARG